MMKGNLQKMNDFEEHTYLVSETIKDTSMMDLLFEERQSCHKETDRALGKLIKLQDSQKKINILTN